MRTVYALAARPDRFIFRSRCESMAASEASATACSVLPSMLAPWPSRGSCRRSRAGSMNPTGTGWSEKVHALQGVSSPVLRSLEATW